MKSKSNYQKLEKIFDHAASLQQSGKLRNTIYCIKNRVYILNQDHTVILKFPLPKSNYFEQPVCFEANDYDSPVFEMKDGQIHFMEKRDGYVRIKSCKVPQQSPARIARLFKTFSDRKIEEKCVPIDNLFLLNLDKSLSHIEFSGSREGFQAIQRNIYSGAIIKIKGDKTSKINLHSKGLKFNQEFKFKTVGLRTNDFMALFSFSNLINFYFSNKDFVWIESKDTKMIFTGIISRCIYDQLGKV